MSGLIDFLIWAHVHMVIVIPPKYAVARGYCVSSASAWTKRKFSPM